MAVESVRVHMLSTQHVVILKDLERPRYLPIWIGPWEANAIAMKLQGVTPERPSPSLLVASWEQSPFGRW
jgi:bifunctional DNase/RNase